MHFWSCFGVDADGGAGLSHEPSGRWNNTIIKRKYTVHTWSKTIITASLVLRISIPPSIHPLHCLSCTGSRGAWNLSRKTWDTRLIGNIARAHTQFKRAKQSLWGKTPEPRAQGGYANFPHTRRRNQTPTPLLETWVELDNLETTMPCHVAKKYLRDKVICLTLQNNRPQTFPLTVHRHVNSHTATLKILRFLHVLWAEYLRTEERKMNSKIEFVLGQVLFFLCSENTLWSS